MSSRVITVFLAVGLALSVFVFAGSFARNYRSPGNDEGFEPIQPIAFSHRLHAGELGIACLHCHSGAETSRTAGVPPLSTCMNCHRFVKAPFLNVKAEDQLASSEHRKPRDIMSPEIKKIFDAMAVTNNLRPDSSKHPHPISWIKVHNLPDFVYFDHRAHVSAGVECQTCHGEIQTMERVRQVSDLSMGWCVNCHRDANANGVRGRKVHASIDCSTCHY